MKNTTSQQDMTIDYAEGSRDLIVDLLDIIEDLDDVQDVYHNAQLDGVPE